MKSWYVKQNFYRFYHDISVKDYGSYYGYCIKGWCKTEFHPALYFALKNTMLSYDVKQNLAPDYLRLFTFSYKYMHWYVRAKTIFTSFYRVHYINYRV